MAPDQRGHGHADRPADFSREGHVADAAVLAARLGLENVVVLGPSLGGVTAYRLAARHPGLVTALVVEDIGAEVDDDLSVCLSWPERAPTRAALVRCLAGSAPYLTDAIREYPDGWGLAFAPEGTAASQRQLNGDHWDDRLAGDCPTLLIRGIRSDVLGVGHARAMVARRPRTRLVNSTRGTRSTTRSPWSTRPPSGTSSPVRDPRGPGGEPPRAGRRAAG
ncbi:alpha/beta hydrolase [Streptomyces sp. NPDC019645]|uniref:alpha/beta fold hydrolase n=1 Tax=Streptomyces sp. NPDC019645 TaxID=3154786 RepID=UPI0033DEE8CC